MTVSLLSFRFFLSSPCSPAALLIRDPLKVALQVQRRDCNLDSFATLQGKWKKGWIFPHTPHPAKKIDYYFFFSFCSLDSASVSPPPKPALSLTLSNTCLCFIRFSLTWKHHRSLWAIQDSYECKIRKSSMSLPWWFLSNNIKWHIFPSCRRKAKNGLT